MQKEQANFRLDADAKQKAYKVLAELGIKPTDAVNMFMHHVATYGELPVKLAIPNTETLATFAKSDAGQELMEFDSIEDMFRHLDSET